MAGQQAPGICLSLPPYHWDYSDKPSHLDFWYMNPDNQTQVRHITYQLSHRSHPGFHLHFKLIKHSIFCRLPSQCTSHPSSPKLLSQKTEPITESHYWPNAENTWLWAPNSCCYDYNLSPLLKVSGTKWEGKRKACESQKTRKSAARLWFSDMTGKLYL